MLNSRGYPLLIIKRLCHGYPWLSDTYHGRPCPPLELLVDFPSLKRTWLDHVTIWKSNAFLNQYFIYRKMTYKWWVFMVFPHLFICVQEGTSNIFKLQMVNALLPLKSPDLPVACAHWRDGSALQ